MANQKRIATQRPEHRRGMTAGEIREERRKRSTRRKKGKRLIITTLASAAAVVLVIAIAVPSLLFTTSVREHEGVNEGGPVPIDPDQGSLVVINSSEGAVDRVIHQTISGRYSVFPSTSGARYFSSEVILPSGDSVSSPTDWGEYSFVLPDEVLVSNLYYGGIGLHYDCAPEDDCSTLVDQLNDIRPLGSILSPYPGLRSREGATIAITGWRHRLFLEEFDEGQIREFIEAYRNRGIQPVFSNNPAILGHQQQ